MHKPDKRCIVAPCYEHAMILRAMLAEGLSPDQRAHRSLDNAHQTIYVTYPGQMICGRRFLSIEMTHYTQAQINLNVRSRRWFDESLRCRLAHDGQIIVNDDIEYE